MQCPACSQYPMTTVRRTRSPLLRGVREYRRLEPFLCAWCGAVLPEWDSAPLLLEKLRQLSRFGLVGSSGALLRRRWGHEGQG